MDRQEDQIDPKRKQKRKRKRKRKITQIFIETQPRYPDGNLHPHFLHQINSSIDQTVSLKIRNNTPANTSNQIPKKKNPEKAKKEIERVRHSTSANRSVASERDEITAAKAYKGR